MFAYFTNPKCIINKIIAIFILFLSLGTFNYPSQATTTFIVPGPQQDLTAYWSFDKEHRSADYVYDISGNNNHGLIENVEFKTDGPKNEYATFNGENASITASSSAFPTTTDGTLAFWIFLPDNNDTNGRALSLSFKTKPYKFSIYYSKDYRLYLSITSGKISECNCSNTKVGFKIDKQHKGRWIHVAWTWKYQNNQASTLVTAYLNGFEKQSKWLCNDCKKSKLSKVPVAEGPIHIGKFEGESQTAFFKGSLDELRLYGRALSEDEIQGIDTNILVRYLSTLIYPDEKAQIEILPMNSMVSVSDLKINLAAKYKGNVELVTEYSGNKLMAGAIPNDSPLVIELPLGPKPDGYYIDIDLIKANSGEKLSSESGEIFVQEKKTLDKLAYLSFLTPRRTKTKVTSAPPVIYLDPFNAKHMDIFKLSPYNALAFRFYGPSGVPRKPREPELGYSKIDDYSIIKEIIGKTGKELHPWVHLSQISVPCKGRPLNTTGLDLFGSSSGDNKLSQFYQIFEEKLKAAKSLASSTIIIDPEFYLNRNLPEGCPTKGDLSSINDLINNTTLGGSIHERGIRRIRILDALKGIGEEMARKIKSVYPDLKNVVFLSTDITNTDSTKRNIVLGMLEELKPKRGEIFKKSPFVIDGGGGHGFYFSCSFDEFKRKMIDRYARYHHVLEEFPHFRLGGTIRPFYHYQHDNPAFEKAMKKHFDSCGESLQILGIEEHSQLLKYLFSTNEYVWIFAAENAGPYDMFNCSYGPGHRKMYEPTIKKAK